MFLFKFQKKCIQFGFELISSSYLLKLVKCRGMNDGSGVVGVSGSSPRPAKEMKPLLGPPLFDDKEGGGGGAPDKMKHEIRRHNGFYFLWNILHSK